VRQKKFSHIKVISRYEKRGGGGRFVSPLETHLKKHLQKVQKNKKKKKKKKSVGKGFGVQKRSQKDKFRGGKRKSLNGGLEVVS